MPVQSWGHRQYWEVSSTQTSVAKKGGYPTWQSAPLSQVLGFGLGGALPLWERFTDRLKWSWRLLRIVVRWDRPQQQALQKAVDILDSPLYPHALRAVKMTANESGFSKGPVAWKGLAHKLHERHHWAENQWRHLQACDHFEVMIRAEGSTISNPDRAIMVEMAYQSFGQHAVGSTKA